MVGSVSHRRAGRLAAVFFVLLMVATAFGAVAAALSPQPSNPASTSASTPAVPPTPSSSYPGTTVIVQGQNSSVSETLPTSGTGPYSWVWLFSTSAEGPFLPATPNDCATPSGSGAASGSTETCTFLTNGTTPTGTYFFELKVTDSASVPESVTSPASSTVTVDPGPSASQRPRSPAFDTDPASFCNSGCDTTNWFAGLHGNGALTITTGATNELLLLEVTDSGESGAGLSTADIKDTQSSTWHLESSHPWNGTGNVQDVFYAIDAVAGVDTVTVDTAAGSLTSATTASAVLSAFTGVNTVTPILTLGTFGTGSGTSSSASVPATVAPTTILGILSNGWRASSITPTSSPAFTKADTISDAVATQSFVEFYSATSTGTYLSNPTWTGTVAWGEEALVVQPPSPLAVTVAPTSTILDQDQSVTITATATGGAGGDAYVWSVSSGTCPGFVNSGAATLTYTPSGTTAGCVLTVTVTDSSSDTAQPTTPSSVTVNTVLTAAAAPTVSATALDRDQALTVTGTIPLTGTPTYSWTWMVSVNSGSYAAETHCGTNGGSGASAGATENCVIPANTLIVGDTYNFELKVTDSATTPETQTSTASPTVTEHSAFTAPAAPTVSAAKLDVDQALTVTGTVPATGTPTYAWQWMVSINAGAYAAATQCAVNSGSGATGGATETCTAAANTLAAGSTYAFELRVTDSATVAETKTSVASATVTVKSALTAAAAPTPSLTSLPASQQLTVTATLPSTGTSTYSWEWFISINGTAYVDTTQCTVNTGSGAAGGAVETCTIPGNTLIAGTTYNFEIEVTDSATSPEVQVSPASATVTTTLALTAGTPTPTAPVLDSGQPVTLTANPSGGTRPFTYQWYTGSTILLCTGLGSPISGATGSSYTFTPGATAYYCYTVTDAVPNTATSATSLVTVNSALAAPSAPVVSATVLDRDQALTVTATIPSTGTAPYQWEWLYSTGGSYAKATMCGTASGNGAVAGAGETCSVAANALTAGNTYTFELLVNDSATTPSTMTSPASSGVAVSAALTAPAAPTVSSSKLDVDQALTVSDAIPVTGSPTYSWQWQVSVNAGVYASATQCAVNSGSGALAGATENCVIAANTLTVGNTYAFKLQVTDGAATPESATSAASATVTVKSVLTAPAVPTVTATALDVDQALSVQGTIPATGTANYAWQWLVSVNSGSYVTSTVCAVNSGVNAVASATETCATAANALTAGDTYNFELKVTDSATTPESQTSGPSPTVTVKSALVAPAAPTVSATKLDLDQALSVQGTIPSTGTPSYAWQWLVSINSGAYGNSALCAVNSGSGATGGATETCSIAAGSLTVSDTYKFELKVTDSATTAEVKTSAASPLVTVKAALTAPAAPTPSVAILDASQVLTVTDNIPATGSSPYSWQWLVSVGGGGFAAATQCSVNSGSGAASGALETCSVPANTLTAGTTCAFELQVTDTANVPESQTSPTSATVTVNSALIAPAAPTVSATKLDVDQSLTVTGTIPTTGTSTYQYEWLYSIGGAYTKATICSVAGGSGVSGGAVATCSIAASTLTAGTNYFFKLRVNDSATNPAQVTSPGSVAVAVASALTAPAAPTLSAPGIDVDQPLTVSGAIPATGTALYSWQWLVSDNGGSYVPAAQCAVSNGSSAAASSPETCSIAGGSLSVGHSYTFELQVKDNATVNETQPSAASASVTVSSSVSGGTPSPTSPSIDAGQAITLSATTTGGSGGYTYQWYSGSTALGCTGLGSPIPGATSSAYLAPPTSTTFYCYVVTDSNHETVTSTADQVTVNTALTAPTAPSVSATSLDADQPLTVTATIPSSGTSPYQFEWLFSVGASYTKATMCAVASGSGASGGTVETCLIAANTLTTGTTYTFELLINDSATTPETTTSPPSAGVTVSTALTAPAAPTPSASKLDTDQGMTVTDTIPTTGDAPYNYEWLFSTGGSYSKATFCAIPSGTGAAGGTVETCSVSASALSAGTTYTFELLVNDTAGIPESATSPPSSGVAVAPALLAPTAPTVSATKLDVNQALTLSGTIPSTGSASYQWEWLVSTGGSYSKSTICATPSGIGAGAGAGETCAVAGGTLSVGTTYTFELLVNDSATTPETATSPASSGVVVSSALTAAAAPTVSATKLDVDQALTVSGTIPSTGTSTYQYEWLFSTGGAYAKATMCATPSGSGVSGGTLQTCSVAANTLTSGLTYTFELLVNDSATAPETATSSASSGVVVSSALTAAAAPTVSATKLDVDQALTVTGTIPSTGTSTYSWAWQVSVNGGGYVATTQCAVNSGSGAIGGAGETCSIAANTLAAGSNYAFELKVTDSAITPESRTSVASSVVTISSALTAPGAPTVSATKLDVNQALTVSGTLPSTGTSTYSWAWQVSVNGGGYVATTQCAVNSGSGAIGGAGETCSIAANTLAAGSNYAFKLKVTDSATVAEIQTSAASSTVTVASALTAPAAPTVSATKLDVDQALTVSGTVPATGTSTYSWQWLVSVNSGGYVATTQCAVNSGSGATGGAGETCSIAANTLAAGSNYAFELKVTDSATTPEIQTSVASSVVTVSSALTAAAAPTVSATALDVDQALTVSGTVPATGTSTYSWQWLVSINSGAYANSALCAVNSGSGATGGAGETCAIAASSLTVGSTYAFELKVTDSATTAETKTSAASSVVTVSSALTAPGAPTVSATKLDVNQALTVSGTLPSTGTSTYSWAWQVSVNGGGYVATTQCAVNSGSGASGGVGETCAIAANALTAGNTYAFELKVTDSATTPESKTSVASSTISVASALGAPSTPSPSATGLDVNQALTVTATVPSTGTPTYQYEWLFSTGGGYAKATMCATPSGSGVAGGSLETCSVVAGALTVGSTYTFELLVNDSATAPETATSSATSGVVVSSALTAAAAPTVSATKLDVDQALTVSGTIPSTGTSTYQYEWLFSTGGAYAKATMCATPSGSGVASGSLQTCSIGVSALTVGLTYTFELLVNDSATTPETATSPASSGVVLSSALTPPAAPTVSATKLDVDQALTVSGTIPSTGTSTYQYEWLFSTGGAYAKATMCATPSGSGVSGGTLQTCSVAANTLTSGLTYTFELLVNDSATAPETATSSASSGVVVSSALTVPSTPTVSATKLDADQVLTVSGTIPSTGTPTYSWQWLVSVNAAAYGNSALCGVNGGSGASSGAGETCSVASSTLTAGNTYAFKLKVTDSATIVESTTSLASSVVTVASALTAPGAPTVSATKLDVNQALTITATVPSSGTSTYSWQWLVQVNAGGFVAASQCAVNSGAGALGGATETCSVGASTLTVGSTYAFELKVTDSATTPESMTSPSSPTVVVASTLGAPAVPSPSATKLDVNQALTVTGTIPSTGTSTYQYEWLFSIGSGYSKATMCATPSGSGVSGGALETCSIASGVLTVGKTYTFELLVNDSATAPETATSSASAGVAVSSALTAASAPTTSATKLDVDQALTVTDTIPSTGTSTYQYEWLFSIGSGYSKATMCATPSASGVAGGTLQTCSVAANALSTGATYTFELMVNDSATIPESATSVASAPVVVSSALTAPTAPGVSATKLDADQALTVTGTIPSTGTSTYQYEWLFTTGGGYSKATMCGTPSASAVAGGSIQTCSVTANTLTAGLTYTFELLVNDSATVPESATSSASAGVAVSSALTVPATPTVSATKLDVDQAVTVSGTIPSSGTSTYSWQWLVSVNSGGYGNSALCAVNSGVGALGGAGVSCSIAASSLSAGSSYAFKLQVTDSATSVETTASLASPTVTVSTALTAPAAPTVSALKLDKDQPLTITGTIPSTGTATYQYEWLFATGGGYTKATVCATPSGSGVSGGTLQTCSVAANALTAGTTYTFELLVNDSATAPESKTSAASSAVVVSSALTAPAAPTVSATKLDLDQVLTVSGAVPLTGTGTYSWQWMISVNLGGYVATTQCAVNGGSGASGGAAETCSIAANTLTAGATYSFELKVSDGATVAETATSSPSSTVAVTTALTAPSAPTVSASKLDRDQVLTVTGTVPSTGTPTYSWQWMISVNGAGFVAATQCAVNGGSGAAGAAVETCSIPINTLTVGSSYAFELEVSDSATTTEAQTSSSSSGVTVNSALTAPATPTVSAIALDVDQALTVSGSIPSSGTSLYSWQWLVSVNGGAFAAATQCTTAGGSGASAGALETCSISSGVLAAGSSYAFELKVTDGASTPETQTSLSSSTVTVKSALTAPAAPTVTATKLDVDQPMSVTGTIPSSGTSPYSWQWLVSENGGSYASATQCATPGGSGATGGTLETCTVSAGTLTVGSTYLFKLQVTDSATVPESQTSVASSMVSVTSALTAAAAPTISAGSLDSDQILTVQGTVPSTGTPSYSWQWLVSVNGGAFGSTTQCAANSGSGAAGGATETCVVPGGTLTPGDTYTFRLQVWDQATAPETSISPSSSSVTVHSVLTAPSAPTPSVTTLDADQPLTVTGTIPSSGTATYSWQWLVSVNGGGFAAATVCAVSSGSGAGSAAVETCSVPGNTLSASTTYAFELQVTDSATVRESATSSSSATVTTSSRLTAGTPVPGASTIDNGQTITLSASPSGGSGGYTYQWYVGSSGPGCLSLGTPIPGAVFSTYLASPNVTTFYCYEVNDSNYASANSSVGQVTVNSALTAPPAPSVTATALDADQPASLSSTIPSSGTATYSWQWFVQVNGAGGYLATTQCSLNGGSGASAGAVETCSIAGGTLAGGNSYTFELQVRDSAASPETATSAASVSVVVSPPLGAPAGPTTTATSLDSNQALTVTGTIPSTGTSTYSWQWLVSVNGGPYGTSTFCALDSGAGASGGAAEQCAIAPGTLVVGDTYLFELRVTDSANTPETATSSASPSVTVATPLSPPAAPTVSATALDADQSLTATGTVPTSGTSSYSWSWMVSVNGAAVSAATECAINGGSGAGAGATETCAVAAGTLSAGSTYAFSLKVIDSASSPEAQTSSPSATVTVSSALTAPNAPSVSATALDWDQTVTVRGTIPSTGTAGYDWHWLVSVNGAAFAVTTQCAVNGGVGASGGTPEVCSIVGGTLAVGDTYVFRLFVRDSAASPESQVSGPSAPVQVASVLAAPPSPTVSATALDSDQALTVQSTIPTAGTGPFRWQWVVSQGSAGFVPSTVCVINNGTGAAAATIETCSVPADTLSSGTSYVFKLWVWDSASSPESLASPPSPAVGVSAALTAPASPLTSATLLDADQALTVSGTLPSTGTATYSWQWLLSVNGATFATASVCGTNSGTAASGGATEKCSIAVGALTAGDSYAFELRVNDSSGAGAESQTSSASATIRVSSSLSAPAAPTPSSASLGTSGSLTVTDTLPSSGSSPYSWQWLVSENGSSFAPATPCGSSASGSGATAGSKVTCSISGSSLTGGATYRFAIAVRDGATVAESATSLGSTAVFIVQPAIAPVASQGPVGAMESLTGDGFSPSAGVRVTFNAVAMTPVACTVGTFNGTLITTDATGRFSCSFRVPAETAGSYPLVGEDVATNSPTSATQFLVTVPTISVNPPTGTTGGQVTVTGTGFSVSTNLASLVFESVTISSCTAGSLTTSATGSFSCTFVVPGGTVGTTIVATDAGGQASTTTFQTVAPSSSSGFPFLWVAVAAAAAAVLLLAVLVLRRRRLAERSRRPTAPEPEGPAPGFDAGPTVGPAPTPAPSPALVPSAEPFPAPVVIPAAAAEPPAVPRRPGFERRIPGRRAEYPPEPMLVVTPSRGSAPTRPTAEPRPAVQAAAPPVVPATPRRAKPEPAPTTPSKSVEQSLGDLAAAFAAAPPMDSSLPLDRPAKSAVRPTGEPTAAANGSWREVDMVLADLESISKQILGRPPKKADEAEEKKDSENPS